MTQHSKQAQWLHIDCLPDQAVEPKPKKDEKVKFQAFHDYKSKDGKLDLKKGCELQLLSGPKNGWIGVVFLDGSKRKGYVPYWVMPHEFRTDDAGAKKK